MLSEFGGLEPEAAEVADGEADPAVAVVDAEHTHPEAFRGFPLGAGCVATGSPGGPASRAGRRVP